MRDNIPVLVRMRDISMHSVDGVACQHVNWLKCMCFTANVWDLQYLWECGVMYQYLWECRIMYQYLWECGTMYHYLWECRSSTQALSALEACYSKCSFFFILFLKKLMIRWYGPKVIKFHKLKLLWTPLLKYTGYYSFEPSQKGRLGTAGALCLFNPG